MWRPARDRIRHQMSSHTCHSASTCSLVHTFRVCSWCSHRPAGNFRVQRKKTLNQTLTSALLLNATFFQCGFTPSVLTLTYLNSSSTHHLGMTSQVGGQMSLSFTKMILPCVTMLLDKPKIYKCGAEIIIKKSKLRMVHVSLVSFTCCYVKQLMVILHSFCSECLVSF